MKRSVTPMLHVPDIDATIRWYESIGFEALDAGKDDGDTVWAMLGYGDGRVMLNIGGQPSAARRREVDLYVETEGVDALYATLKDRVDVVEAPHDTFYGMRELIIRDLNRFWITFGEPVPESGEGEP
jgi:uncharacterized glyoxalase superfamily protein PhnB